MQTDHHGASHALPPHIQLIQMVTAGAWASRMLHAAATLELADQLAGGPKDAVELAALMHVHAPSLHRLMRSLAGVGILTEGPGQRYGLTPLGEALKTGAPGSAKATVLTFGGPAFQNAWDHFVYSIQTGKTGF